MNRRYWRLLGNEEVKLTAFSAERIECAYDFLADFVSLANRPHGKEMRGLQIGVLWRVDGGFSRIRANLNTVNRATEIFSEHFAHLAACFRARVLPIHKLLKLPKMFAGIRLPKNCFEPLQGREVLRREGGKRK